MNYFPIFLDIRGRACLVVGGGPVAARKAAALLDAGARVRLVAPELDPAIEEMGRAGEIRIERRPFRDSDLDGCALVIAATDDEAVNRAVHAGARRRDLPCNVVDQPSLCTFIFPSVLRRGDLVIAISTGGASPAVCRRLRRELEGRIGPEYADFLSLMREVRSRLRKEVSDPLARKRALYRLVSSPALDLVRSGRAQEARALAERLIAEAVRSAAAGPAPGRSSRPSSRPGPAGERSRKKGD